MLTDTIKTNVKQLFELTKQGTCILRMPDGSLVSTTDFQQALNKFFLQNNENAILSILKQSCKSSEKVCMNSSQLMISFLEFLLENSYSDEEIKVILNKITEYSTRASETSVTQILGLTNPDVSDLINETLNLAGGECKIFIEPSTTNDVIIERKYGHTFIVQPNPLFLSAGKWSALNVKCLIVDGLIEKVSEIDHLLTACHHDKTPMILFARGYSDEVISTLHVNFVKKKLNVIPVTVEFDLETVNVLVDIATVAGSDVVSSLKGELISMVKYVDLPVIENVNCMGSNVMLKTPIKQGLNIHLRNLIQKRNNESLMGVQKILDNRIRSLSSSSVILKVSNYGTEGSVLMNQIDSSLKIVRNVLQYGTITKNELMSIDKNCFKRISQELNSSFLVATGLYYAYETFKQLKSIGLFI